MSKKGRKYLEVCKEVFQDAKNKKENDNYIDSDETYISNKQGLLFGTTYLPPPISKDEEEYYLNLKEMGDLEASNRLIEHNLRLAIYIAMKYKNTNVDIEDLVSYGIIGLIKAVKTYKLDKNTKLATYASHCIKNEIIMCLRRNYKLLSEISLDAGGDEIFAKDFMETDFTVYLDNQSEMQMVIDEIAKLDKRDQLLITLRYGLSGEKAMTQKEVAELLNMSQTGVLRAEKRVADRIKRYINAKYL